MNEDFYLESHHELLISTARELGADPTLVFFLTMVCYELTRYQQQLEELQRRLDEAQKTTNNS